MTNEGTKAASKEQEGTSRGYYKAAMCHSVGEICGADCHTHRQSAVEDRLPPQSLSLCVSVCHCVMKSKEVGGILLFYNSVDTENHHSTDI